MNSWLTYVYMVGRFLHPFRNRNSDEESHSQHKHIASFSHVHKLQIRQPGPTDPRTISSTYQMIPKFQKIISSELEPGPNFQINVFETSTNFCEMNLIRTPFVLHLLKHMPGPVQTLHIIILENHKLQRLFWKWTPTGLSVFTVLDTLRYLTSKDCYSNGENIGNTTTLNCLVESLHARAP